MAIRCAQCSRWLSEEEARFPCPRCGGTERTVFDDDQDVAEEKIAVARELATMHFEAEPGLQRIFRLKRSAEAERTPVEPIKLLEVNSKTVPSGILPVQFGPSPSSGIPYPSVIVEVSPDEFKQIESQDLMLPKGWSIAEEMPRPASNGGP